MPTAPLLDLHELVVTFGGLRAVDGVSMHVNGGMLVGLIGPNGAGKSTIVDAVTGFVPTAGGSIAFDGDDVTHLSAHRRARRGLARTFQSLELFEDLTIAENVRVPATVGRFTRSIRRQSSTPREPDAGTGSMLERLGLDGFADDVPAQLAQADRRNLVLARALAGKPKLLLLDEPAAGLDARGTAALGTRLRDVVHDGTTILLVDHDMSLVLEVCDYVYVMDTGRLIAAGTPAEVRRDPEVLRSYLGEEPAEVLEPGPPGGEA